jgi:hypothetical protein
MCSSTTKTDPALPRLLTLKAIVSGAQTGVDRGALDAALELRFPCGGWCPPGRKAEDGAVPDRYPVHELVVGGYRKRTIRNVLNSDGTLIIYFSESEGGTAQTLLHCSRLAKPCLAIDAAFVPVKRAAALAAAFIDEHHIETLNVAGPRASKEPRGHQYAQALTLELLRAAIG